MSEIKIAIASNDGKSVSGHFGPTKSYLVVTIQDNEIINQEIREKFSHHKGSHDEGEHHHNHDHEHQNGNHEHGNRHDKKHHNRMIENILDCQYMLVKSMGNPVHDALTEAGIKPILTNIKNIEEAVKALLDGTIDNNTHLLH